MFRTYGSEPFASSMATTSTLRRMQATWRAVFPHCITIHKCCSATVTTAQIKLFTVNHAPSLLLMDYDNRRTKLPWKLQAVRGECSLTLRKHINVVFPHHINDGHKSKLSTEIMSSPLVMRDWHIHHLLSHTPHFKHQQQEQIRNNLMSYKTTGVHSVAQWLLQYLLAVLCRMETNHRKLSICYGDTTVMTKFECMPPKNIV